MTQPIKLTLTNKLANIVQTSQQLLVNREIVTEVAAAIGQLQLLVKTVEESVLNVPEQGHQMTLKKALLNIPLDNAIAHLNQMSVHSSSIEAALFHDLMDIRNYLISAKHDIVRFVAG